jgi:hypothetical protein
VVLITVLKRWFARGHLDLCTSVLSWWKGANLYSAERRQRLIKGLAGTPFQQIKIYIIIKHEKDGLSQYALGYGRLHSNLLQLAF